MLQLLSPLRPHLAGVAAFSVLINLLMLAPALYMLQVFDRVLASRHVETLLLLSAMTLVALLAMALLEVLRSRLLGAAATALERGLGPRVHLATLQRPGDTHPTNDLTALRNWLASPGLVALCDLPWLPFYLLLIALFHPLLAAVAAAGAALMLALAVLGERAARAPQQAGAALRLAAEREAEQAAAQAELLQVLGMGGHWAQAQEERLARAGALQARAARRTALFSGMTKGLRQALQVAMMGCGAWLVIAAGATPGVLVATTLLLGRALAPVEGAIAGWRGFVEARAAGRRLQALLDRPPVPAGVHVPATGALQVDRVSVAPPGSPRLLLQQLSFALEPGRSLAVLGPTGAGKSTLARLLAGALRPTAGSVRLDGGELFGSDTAIGYLPQDGALLDGSVRDNIARWNPAADDAAVAEAAQLAQAHAAIAQLPQGYATRIGHGGWPLAAGQRQRIALARALLGTPALVVLDEPTTGLDADGEAAVVQLLQQLKSRGTTVVVVTQRPALVAAVDEVLLLRGGRMELRLPKARFLAQVGRLARAAAPQDAVGAAHG